MLSLKLNNLSSVLLLGAHADDIEVGCGGTILRLIREHPGLSISWIVFSAKGRRRTEAKASARVFLKGAGQQRVLVKSFKDGFFPFHGAAVKDYFEELKVLVQPDLVFTHYREDRHQDHRLLSDLAWNTFRNHIILEYEIPKYDGDLGSPNLFIPLDEDVCRRKVEHLGAFFQTQGNKHWFSADTFLALMRLRGIECASKYSEAFYCRKIAV
jgi:LmbE family N-acetylglucosaminyl deacetylase